MLRKSCQSVPLSIFIAGDITEAIEECADYCNEIGLCVTVTQTTYIYRGGREQGIIVGLINYPRYPLSIGKLWRHAERLAERLREVLKQQSYTIQSDAITEWYSHRDEDVIANKPWFVRLALKLGMK